MGVYSPAMMRFRFLVMLPAMIVALLLVAVPGCGGDDDPEAFGTRTNTNDGGSGPNGEGICLLNNCDLDRDCADCEGGQSVCLQKEHRCIACGPSAGNKACGAGTYCTKYGNCVPTAVSCKEDAAGAPSGSCKNNADCGACGPKFRVCNAAIGKCVGCSTENTTNCQSTDVCKNDTCAPKCPTECTKDDDCGECGAGAAAATGRATACNKHVCAQCSPTKACPNGDRCDLEHGTCIKGCGLGRPGKSNCSENGNCAGCEGTTSCKLPVNGGEGVCAAPVTGCSDIGKGIIVLPDPFSRYTNTCSDDPDCANVSADINVGKILRDVTGIEAIKDGNISYGMKACASVEVLDKSCGVCVPCKQDTDCTDIDATKVAGDIFGPLGSIGASILLDKAFGPNDHKVHMFCQNVAGDYGVCTPCPNVLGRCAQTSDAVPPSGKCDHDTCTTGTALGLQCELPSTCVADVCAKDPYCCIKEWDSQCKADVDLYCKQKTCEPDKCIYRPAGWYCLTDASKGAYRCTGTPGATQVAEGQQCNVNTECRTEEEGPKEPAILCTTEGDSVPGCPLGSKGKPKCFPR